MNNQIFFSKVITNQTVFFNGWVINEFNGMSYLCPNEGQEILENFIIKNELVNEILDIGRYIDGCLEPYSKDNTYIPCIPITLETIRDDKFYFFKDKKSKEHINFALLNLLNEFGGFPLNTEYYGFSDLINSIILDVVPAKLPPLFNPYEHIIPTGLLAHTLYNLYQLCSDFLSAKEGYSKSYETIFTTNLSYNQGVWHSTAQVSNVLESLKLHLVNDRTSGKCLIRQCEYELCKKIFMAKNPKQKRCSKACTNRANVKNNYDKRKVSNNAKAKK